jgi:hypothetical protein
MLLIFTGVDWPFNGECVIAPSKIDLTNCIGEIDIIEGVNRNNFNSISLHTGGDNCQFKGTGVTATSTFNGGTSSYMGGNTNGGGFADMDPTSYGAGLNAIQGGVYAMEWTSDWIRVWFFPRGQIPESITNGIPNITEFGTPRANFEFLAVNGTTNCTMDQSFANHQIIFDTVRTTIDVSHNKSLILL